MTNYRNKCGNCQFFEFEKQYCLWNTTKERTEGLCTWWKPKTINQKDSDFFPEWITKANLKSIEWAGNQEDMNCPVCWGLNPNEYHGEPKEYFPVGHSENCWIKKALGN